MGDTQTVEELIARLHADIAECLADPPQTPEQIAAGVQSYFRRNFPPPWFEVDVFKPSDEDKKNRVVRLQVVERPTITITINGRVVDD